MDSMRSLNTSLPRSFPRRHPPADLHQAFKAAALSVAQLYKTAAADEDHARAAGYQDAIEELLAFLDQENLGLGDGEGWRVRQWATERLSPVAYGSDREDDVEDIRPSRSTSPILQRRPADQNISDRSTVPTVSVTQTSTIPPSNNHSTQTQIHDTDSSSTKPGTFHFRASLPPVDDTEMSTTERATSAPTSSIPTERSTADNTTRLSRNHNNRHGLRARASATALATLGLSAGAKRKSPFSDLFEQSSQDHNRDGSGGGKRGRFI